MKIDVVIPVHKASKTFAEAIRCVVSQSVPKDAVPRCIIISDGAGAGIVKIIRRQVWPAPWEEPLIIERDHEGVSSARNAGIAASDADIVLLLGSDILLRPRALAIHLEFHANHPDAHDMALGMVRWDPRMRPSPLMEWMIHGGPQNNFDDVLGSTFVAPRRYFFGSHVSVKQKFLQMYPFPRVYPQYGWEDLDLGQQLEKHGGKLYVLHHAIGLHHHVYTPHSINVRQRAVGASFRVFARRYPSEPTLPALSFAGRIKLWAYMLGGGVVVRLLVGVVAKKYAWPRLFTLNTAAEFWSGWFRAKS